MHLAKFERFESSGACSSFAMIGRGTRELTSLPRFSTTRHRPFAPSTVLLPRMNKLRLGLIGYGAWGSHHARAIAEAGNTELIAIAARSAETQAAAREKHPGGHVCGDWRELLARPDIDAVDVVLPTDLHYEVARGVLEAGKHLLLEKPMAPSIAQCDELIALAQARRLRLAIGHELRLSSLWGKVKELIAAG